MTYMTALAGAEDGFYPLGASGYWHGGIHFGQKTGESLKQDEGVRAVATGEVVAYRLDSTYPELTYQDKRSALYSTGFVLVRHTLTLPPVPKQSDPAPAPSNAAAASPASAPAGASGANPTPPASAPTPTSPPPDESLTFFSLYMHTLDWNTYKAALDQAKKANPNPTGSHLKLPPYWEADHTYKALKPNTQEVSKAKPHDTHGSGGQGHVEQCDANTSLPGPVPGVRVRITPGKGKLLGLLPEGTELAVNESDNGGTPGWVKIKEIISGTPVGPMMGQPADPQLPWGYVFKSELEPIIQSGPVDKVVVLKKPYPVKAGDIIAHLGQYQRYREAKLTRPQPTRSLLHLEVFAGPDLPAFIKKSQARVGQLPDIDKPFLEILAGAKLVSKIPDPDYTLQQTGLRLAPISDPKSRWVKVQPKAAAPAAQPTPADPAGKGKKSKPTPSKKHGQNEASIGDPFWVDSSLVNQTTNTPVKGWKNFPLKVSQADGAGTDFRSVFRVADLDKQGLQDFAREDKDASGKTKRWWNVIVGTKDGGTRQGWVREQDPPYVKLCSPWDWPGFDLVDNSSVTPSEMFKRYLFVAGLAIGADQESFKTTADTLATSELIQKLEKAIDADHNGSVTAAELANAQVTPWLAEAISHMVVKSESEWGGNMGQWEAITPLMKIVQWRWLNEMERIRRLQWWEDVQCTDVKILPKEPKPWHLHPIGLIGNFASTECCAITVELLEKVYEKSGDWFTGKGGSRTFIQEFPEKYPNIYKYDKYKFVALLNAKMKEYGIVECYHKAHFLAQCFHESARFETTVEFASGEGYNPGVHRDAIKNGNTVVGDGPKYKGKGIIQLTWKNNYAAYSAHRKIDFVANPELIATDMENAIDASCWYWRHKGTLSEKYDAKGDINILIDHEKNNVTLITLAVNGGDRGLPERKALFERIKKEWRLA
ncbi:calcium-binding protein [Burkholderia contaminans]|nr:calcium-binding protein [Burkholderia contaminans]